MAAHATRWSAKSWLGKEWWPLFIVTGATVASMGVYFKRHFHNDPEVNAPRTRSEDSLPIPNVPKSQREPGYGLKSAQATGLMEGDRPNQGIFPSKKIVEKLGPVLGDTTLHDVNGPENTKQGGGAKKQ